jgi:SAM-dependent methyltransferase
MKPDIQTQKNYYDAMWNNIDYNNSLRLKRCIAILEGISKTKLKKPRILDLGSGNGWLSCIVGLFGPTLGVDLSENAIQISRMRFPHVDYLSADILNWDYKGDKFDIIISQEVIEHVEDQKEYLRIAYDLLRPDGFLILTTPNRKIFESFPEEQQIAWSNQPIEKWLSLADLKKMVIPGFKIIKLRTIIPGYGAKGILRLFNSHTLRMFWARLGLLDVYENLCLILGFGLHIFLLARKKSN